MNLNQQYTVMNKISIMIVDDHALIRAAFSLMLSLQANFEVIASTGENEKVIDMAREKRPDVLLLDINMAPVNGIDMIKKLRNNSPATKIIGVSMRTQPVYVQKMLRLGARGYLTKNSTEPEMIRAINIVHAGGIFICSQIKDILSEQLTDGSGDKVGLDALSGREIEIIGLLKDGGSSKEIGRTLNISSKTVEVHRHHILKKLKMKNTVSVISYLNSFAFDF